MLEPEEGPLLNDEPGAISPERTAQLRRESDANAAKQIRERVAAGKIKPEEAQQILTELEQRLDIPSENPEGLRK
jgi:hypothetical protein